MASRIGEMGKTFTVRQFRHLSIPQCMCLNQGLFPDVGRRQPGAEVITVSLQSRMRMFRHAVMTIPGNNGLLPDIPPTRRTSSRRGTSAGHTDYQQTPLGPGS